MTKVTKIYGAAGNCEWDLDGIDAIDEGVSNIKKEVYSAIKEGLDLALQDEPTVSIDLQGQLKFSLPWGGDDEHNPSWSFCVLSTFDELLSRLSRNDLSEVRHWEDDPIQKIRNISERLFLLSNQFGEAAQRLKTDEAPDDQ